MLPLKHRVIVSMLHAMNAQHEFAEHYILTYFITSGTLCVRWKDEQISKAIVLDSIEVVKEKIEINIKYATQLLIFGYMHEMFEWTNIPEDILNVCHIFYYQCDSEDLISCTTSLIFEM